MEGRDERAGHDGTDNLDDYNPEIFARGVVRESEDDGIGIRPEKHGAPMLRLFTKDHGRPWLLWGGVTGGDQDPAGEKWFELFYHGMLRFEGAMKFGHFVVRVEGEGLEQLCHQMAKHVRTNLRIGRTGNHDHPIVVSAITIRPLEFEDME